MEEKKRVIITRIPYAPYLETRGFLLFLLRGDRGRCLVGHGAGFVPVAMGWGGKHGHVVSRGGWVGWPWNHDEFVARCADHTPNFNFRTFHKSCAESQTCATQNLAASRDRSEISRYKLCLPSCLHGMEPT